MNKKKLIGIIAGCIVVVIVVVITLRTNWSILSLGQNPERAVVQEFIEASITQDIDRARDCVNPVYELSLDDWPLSEVIRAILQRTMLKNSDQIKLNFYPSEEASVQLKSGEYITLVVVPCQVMFPDETHLELRFYLAEEQDGWKIWGRDQPY